jgi:endonuclease YncB( thermonuclease family)
MMKFRLINSKTWFLFFLLILFFGFLTQSWFFSQSNEFLRVIGIKDGDTVVLLTAAKTEITVRLSEIDAPERKQAFGTVSRTFLSDLIFGKEVSLEKMGTDRYGRTLGFIFLRNGTNVNVEMVKNGMAWQYEKYSKSVVLKKAQASAKSMKTGLWRDPYPVAPWEFRRK